MLKRRVALTAFIAVCDSARFEMARPIIMRRIAALSMKYPNATPLCGVDGEIFIPFFRALSHTAINAVSATRFFDIICLMLLLRNL